MRLSRWHTSSYETQADLEAERALLSPLVEVLSPGSDAEILVTTSQLRVDAGVLARAPSVRWVLTTTSGYDHLDLGLLAQAGIGACRLPEARRDAVVESALSLMIQGLRREGVLRERARQGTWARGELPALGLQTLAGSPVGIVGLGVIGKRMATVLQALGAQVQGWDPAGVPPGVAETTVQDMVAGCVALTLHCSLSEASRGLVDEALLARARPGLVLVNTARGEVVVPEAAVAALDAGRLGFLGLDVFPEEPWPGLAQLAARPGVGLSPHSAGYHRRLSQLVSQGLARAVAAIVAGEPPPYRVV